MIKSATMRRNGSFQSFVFIPSLIIRLISFKLYSISIMFILISTILIQSSLFINQVNSRSISSKKHSFRDLTSDYDLLSDDPFVADPYLRSLSDSPHDHSMSGKLKDLYDALITASKITKTNAERVKMKFVSFQFFFQELF